ncbi:MAG TPA: hypothetical protein ENJ01_02240 [Gammaproteobacteria bacterium]|nr:hypothetical protein [Gammaproteobacteria bacterium]
MSNEQIIGLGVRLFAIFLFVLSIDKLMNLLFWLGQGEAINVSAVIYSAIVAIVVFLVCLVLWFFPMTTAGKLLPAEQSNSTPVNLERITIIGFVLMGLWVLTNAISDAIYWFVFVNAAETYGGWYGLDIDARASIIATVVEVLMGLWLVLGARGLRTAIWRAFPDVGSTDTKKPPGSG